MRPRSGCRPARSRPRCRRRRRSLRHRGDFGTRSRPAAGQARPEPPAPRPPDRMLRGRLDRPREPKHSASGGAPSRSSTPSSSSDALGDRAGLVEDDRVDTSRLLEHLWPANQHAELSAPPRGHHQRSRSREPQGAGAGDDEHRDRGRERGSRPASEREPAAEREERERDHDRYEHGRDTIGESLSARLPGLGLVHEPGDPGKDGLRPDARRAGDDTAVEARRSLR